MIIHFPLFQPFPNLIHGFADKSEGNFNDTHPDFAKSIENLKRETGLKQNPITARQVHGDTILLLDQYPEIQPKCDAMITRTSSLPLMVKLADCQGILIYDPVTKTIAAVHSGWRGSALNIIGKTITRLKKLGSNPEDLLIAIGPSLGPCCAEFSDPLRELPTFCHSYLKGNHMDLWSLTLDQCKTANVPEKQIELVRECTACHPDRYFSYRRGDAERMGVFIMLTTQRYNDVTTQQIL